MIDILWLTGQIEPHRSAAAFSFTLDYERARLEARASRHDSPASRTPEFFALHECRDGEEAADPRGRNARRAIGMLLSDVVVTTVWRGTLPPKVTPVREGLTRPADWYGLADDAAAQNHGKNSGKDIDNAAAR